MSKKSSDKDKKPEKREAPPGKYPMHDDYSDWYEYSKKMEEEESKKEKK